MHPGIPYGSVAELAAAKLVKNARLEIYKGGGHGLPATDKDRVNADLLAFIKG